MAGAGAAAAAAACALARAADAFFSLSSFFSSFFTSCFLSAAFSVLTAAFLVSVGSPAIPCFTRILDAVSVAA